MATPKEQLDLFVAIVGDVPLRDDREAMSAPMVSIAKRGPREIEWTGPKGQHVVITCGDDADGIATIYDFDVVIWAISQVNAMMERGGEPSPTITFRPYDLLRAVNRGVSGRDYERFKQAVNRLRSTRIRTTIRRRHKDRLEDFNLLADFTLDEDPSGRPLGAQLTLPRWSFRAITEQRDVLAISPLYFDLSSGLDRFLYRLARRHAGNGRDNPYGWRFSFDDLHRRSGSQSSLKGFTRDLRRAIERNALPTYTLSEEAGPGGRCSGPCSRRARSGDTCCHAPEPRAVTHRITCYQTRDGRFFLNDGKELQQIRRRLTTLTKSLTSEPRTEEPTPASAGAPSPSVKSPLAMHRPEGKAAQFPRDQLSGRG